MEDKLKIEFIENFIKELEFYEISSDLAENICLNLGLEKNYYFMWFYNGIDEIITEIDNYFDSKLELIDLSSDTGISSKIKKLLIGRIFLENGRYKNAYKKISSFYLTPSKIHLKIKNSYKSIDKMWHLSSDKSLDFSYYSKRAILFAIYNLSLEFFLRNDDNDIFKTESLIDTQLKKIGLITKIKKKIPKISDISFVRQFFK